MGHSQDGRSPYPDVVCTYHSVAITSWPVRAWGIGCMQPVEQELHLPNLCTTAPPTAGHLCSHARSVCIVRGANTVSLGQFMPSQSGLHSQPGFLPSAREWWGHVCPWSNSWTVVAHYAYAGWARHAHTGKPPTCPRSGGSANSLLMRQTIMRVAERCVTVERLCAAGVTTDAVLDTQNV